MSVSYSAIGWNRQKRRYSGAVAAFAALYLCLFAGAGSLAHPDATIETVLIRGFGTLALLMLHVVLAIGPLCRLDARFLPLLYNRRHLGVATFLAGAAHGLLSLFQFHALGDVHPLVSLLISNPRFDSVPEFPFQLPGLLALMILFAMAATSHDFWLRALTPRVWKGIHMLVYLAYALLIGHVSLGALQSEKSPWLVAILAAGIAGLCVLHLLAASKDRDRTAAPVLEEIPENRACVVTAGGERVAVFRQGGGVSAVSNVCRHQGGPLGEGKITGGCITCPWHGYQYAPDTGAAPPPFDDQVAAYETRIVEGTVRIGHVKSKQ